LAFLVPLANSAEFAAVRPRVAGGRFLDSWQEDGLHFFVFRLAPVDAAATGHAAGGEPPVAVFAMHPESSGPVSAVVVTPLPGGAEAEVRDLCAPDSVYVAPVPA
jgi:hypothetical protein